MSGSTDFSANRAALNNETIRISGIIEESISNGPGLRLVVFAQGCNHRCPGCHNPQTHDFEGGYSMTLSEIVNLILDNPLLDGITLSGGDPFEQARGFGLLAEWAQAQNFNVTTYTGYTFEELQKLSITNPNIANLICHTDLLIDGPFKLTEKSGLLKFRGSENQRLIDVAKTLESSQVIIAAI